MVKWEDVFSFNFALVTLMNLHWHALRLHVTSRNICTLCSLSIHQIWNSPYSSDSFPVYAEDIDAGGIASPSIVMLFEVPRALKITIVGGSISERSGDKLHLFDIDIPGKVTFKVSKTLIEGETPTVVDID
ncbi:hypothetical protein Nepgr_032644 [Nepenthes gracilis]|uniref:Uncharacterized protein n=1 Tax=Nepenthes gracilis TaxID=150966 RepID=A0AAD3TKL8_NEPGR|nr:hypothetical protein Nepgr_032644 [Nepenthes gracilis]